MTMNQFNMTENGCSLEDCHTNLFALTDLTGIKWQRLSAQTDACIVDPTEDSVLLSYSKCIQSDILCVWRRQRPDTKLPDQLMSNPKELWIFWYGQDPPANLSSLISPELAETESGSWESGLTYDCRTLLFKALHNLIERCLLSHNFVRVGKWFVQPCSQQEGRCESRANLSISFLFFLHGESTVCASIDVRQHPPLYSLHTSHVTVASQYSQGVQVLLAPYGMSGSLTGRSFAESDQRAQKMLDDWRRFFCFPKAENQGMVEEGKELPAAVEVIVAGMRLCYPSSFVFLTGETLDLLSRNHSSLCDGGTGGDGSSSSSSGAIHSSSSYSASSSSSGPLPDLKAKSSSAGQAAKLLAKTEVISKKVLAQRVIERAWQDSTLTSGLVSNSRNQTDAMDSIGSGGGGIKEESSSSVVWNFSEPMQKNPCICAKTKSMKMKAGTSGLLNKQQTSFLSGGRPGKGEKSDKTDKDRPRHLQRSFAPYHRRSVCNDADSSIVSTEMDFALPQNLSSTNPKLSAEPSLPFGRGSGGGGSSGGGGGQGGTVDSPHSGVPSPLISSQTQPSVNQNCDPTMPTLSPHPLPSKSERDAGGASHGGGVRVKDCQDLNASCGSTASSTAAAQSTADYDSSVKMSSSATEKMEKSGVGGGGAGDGCGELEDQTARLTLGGVRQMKKEAFKTWQEDQAERLAKFTMLKRPNLPLLFEDEDAEDGKGATTMTTTRGIYDYPQDSVMDQPSKRMRSSTDHLDNPSSSESPVDAFGHDKMAAAAMMRNAPGHLFVRPGMMGRGGDLPSPSMHGGGAQMSEDPYQFSDEADSNMVKNMNLHAVRSASRDEGFPTKPTTFRQDDQYRPRGADGSYDNDDYRISMEFSPSPTSKGEQTTKLMTDDDLKPKIQDLEKMFDTDEEECDADSPASPEKPNGDLIASSVFAKISPSLGITGSSIYPTIQGPTSKDLSRMFPTPPSADNPSSEPMQDADFITETAYLVMSATDLTSHHHQHHLYSNTSYHLVPKEEAVKHSANVSAASIRKDCPFVYKVPALSVFPTATIYDPIDLPSNHVEPLTSASRLIYSSSYQPQHPTDKLSQPISNQYLNRHAVKSVISIGGGYPGPSRNPGVASMDSSPAMLLGPPLVQQRTPRTPMSYESPASASSSCFNRNVQSIGGQTPEVNSLAVNILLTDSILNVFKDVNFDSCTICVCNTNIDGNDVGLYLPDRPKEDMFRCHCAFSAVVNRRHGLSSGLFYEDEVDITGFRHGYFDARKRSLLQSGASSGSGASGDHPDVNNGMKGGLQGGAVRDDVEDISQDIMMLLKDQFSTLYPSCAVLASHQAAEGATPAVPEWGSLEYVDGQNACFTALEFGRLMAADICNQSHIDKSSPCLHKWPYVQSMAKISKNSQDIVRLLKSLQPLLQDALQKKRTTKLWESVYNISGPLSWKDFHLMAGRGSEETSEPKPVPNVLVGFGKEWMALSPHAIRYWDKLMLEPYSEPRNVLFIIVSPDNDYVLSQAAVFVRELGVMYEQCRMGEHKPLTEKLRDGVLRIGKTNADRLAAEPVDDWFRDIGNSQTAAQLRLYAQVCRRLLGNLISQHLPEKSAASDEASSRSAQYQQFQQHQQQQQQQQMSSEASSFQTASSTSSLPSSLSSGTTAPTGGAGGPGDHHLHGSLFDAPTDASFSQQQQQQDSETDHSDGGFLGGGAGGRGSSGSGEGPFVVLYLIEPFTYGQRDTDLGRLAMFGILRCYHDLLRSLPEQMQRRVQLQIIPQHVLLDFDHVTGSQYLKNVCFSVYANCHRVLTKSITGRSLTGFGTAAACENFLQDHKQLTGGEVSSVQLYTPPFILAPSPSTTLSLGAESWSDPVDRSGVLLCAYCLSEDQRWLLVSCTDSSGELLETCCINIEVPKRRHRKKPQVARTGLLKLWDFLLGVMANTNQPWRVVIGRFGRLGHGELQAWSNILNRKRLQQCSQKLRNICKMCGILQSSQIPCILSACLVSMELHPSIHIMIDSVKREENQSSKCQMTTPRDASATHILVFPTSASARSHDPMINLPDNPMEFADEDILSVFNSEDIGEDMGGDMDFDFPFPPNSPKNQSAPGSPMDMGKQFGGGEPNHEHSASLTCDMDEMNSQLLLQQPLAMGFYISTAPTGPLPKWFWSSCPERENFCPACFKAALHIHCSSVQQNQDDPLHQPHQPHPSKHSHPLDSNVTTDVLRYVLETYNQLSWLTMDPMTNDRRSCLPLHILVLMQLYHGIDRYV